MRRLLFTFGIIAAAFAPVTAQGQSGQDEVLKVVRQLFDGMRKGDSAMVRAVFHPDAVLLRPMERDGQVTIQKVPIENFIRAIGTPHPEVWDEKVWNEKVFVDDRLATAWMEYGFFLGTKLSHCGVDAFTFVKMADGWKIVGLADTQRRANCKVPN